MSVSHNPSMTGINSKTKDKSAKPNTEQKINQ